MAHRLKWPAHLESYLRTYTKSASYWPDEAHFILNNPLAPPYGCEAGPCAKIYLSAFEVSITGVLVKRAV
jgi:hypothetical protein